MSRPSRVPGGLRLFVVHAPEDEWFVHGFLLRSLELPAEEVRISSEPELGQLVIRAIEKGAVSPVTVVIMSPHFLSSPMARFASDLAMYRSVEAIPGQLSSLIPLVLADCEMPLAHRPLVSLDLRNRASEHWEREIGRLRAKLSSPAPEETQIPCPYPGLRPFTTEESVQFHGRDEEIDELQDRLHNGRRELYVIGPSGSGKSSLVAAGLLPALRDCPDLVGRKFLVLQMRPGASPVPSLWGLLRATDVEKLDASMTWVARAVGRLLVDHPGHDRVLLFVDQLEELFTTAAGPARAAFIEAVRMLRKESQVVLLFALRADFYAALMESALWADLGGKLVQLPVSPLRGDKLRMAIEKPARTVGVHFEPVLVERLLNEVAGEPGALPLLQFTLRKLWYKRTRELLRLADYDAMGNGTQSGLALAVARRADDAVADLSSERQTLACRIFLRLVQFSEGGGITRRQQSRAALSSVCDRQEEVDVVVRHLADQGLITTSSGDEADQWARVDLAHEVLLSAWSTLSEWISKRKEEEQHRRLLEAKAGEWIKSGRGTSRLLDVEELQEVRGWLSDEKLCELGMSADVRALLSRSESFMASQRERETAVRTQLARNNISQANAQLMAGRPARAIPFLVAAREAGVEDVALRMLFRWAVHGSPVSRLIHPSVITAIAWNRDRQRVAAACHDGAVWVWHLSNGARVPLASMHEGPVHAVAWSSDGCHLATASEDGTARVWDVAGGGLEKLVLRHGDAVNTIAWSEDGRYLATASEDETAQIWDSSNGAKVGPPLRHRGAVLAVAWSGDSTRVVTGSRDGAARIWDTWTGRPQSHRLLHGASVVAAAWSPDNRRVATASWDETARIWDVERRASCVATLPHKGRVTAVSWSWNGELVATASDDSTARIWHATTGMALAAVLRHRGPVTAVIWGIDGRRLATASRDGTARVWDVWTGEELIPALEHRSPVTAISWSSDERCFATAGADGAVRLWNMTSERELLTMDHVTAVTSVAWSPSGKRVATTTLDGEARLWDPSASTTPPIALRHQGWLTSVAWSSDGKRVVTACEDGSATVWDAESGENVAIFAHSSAVLGVAWSCDGKRVATACRDRAARIWGVAEKEMMVPALQHQDSVGAVAWSPDGCLIATASDDHTVQIWDAATGTALSSMAHRGKVTSVAWSGDGSRVATASWDRQVRIWDATRAHQMIPSLEHTSGILALAWRSDGHRLATASADGTARVWDAKTGAVVTAPMEHHSAINAIGWSPDGALLATASSDGHACVWDAESGAQVMPMLAHEGDVLALSWSPDGTKLATASKDHTAKIWDISRDDGTVADWRAALERGEHRLNDKGVLVELSHPDGDKQGTSAPSI